MDKKKETTDELLASRRAIYGDRVKNMERTAMLWSALLGVTIEDWQVPLMMSAYKMLRTFETPDYSDNSDDIDGWKKMFVEVMEANYGGIIQARTVEEYQAQKDGSLYLDRQSLIGQIENLKEQLDVKQEQNEELHEELQQWKEPGLWVKMSKDRVEQEEGSGNPYANVPDEPVAERTDWTPHDCDKSCSWTDGAGRRCALAAGHPNTVNHLIRNIDNVEDEWVPADQRCSWKDPAGRQCTYPLHAPSLPHHVRNIHTRERGK